MTPPANDARKSAGGTVRDRKLERWERMTHGDRSEGDGDPEALDRWRKFMAGALPPKQL